MEVVAYDDLLESKCKSIGLPEEVLKFSLSPLFGLSLGKLDHLEPRLTLLIPWLILGDRNDDPGRIIDVFFDYVVFDYRRTIGGLDHIALAHT